MLREIVLSSTYRQTNRAPAALVSRDPQNRLLARGPRNRLTAEMVRDQALAVAGLLSPKLHGPPVFPPQPQGVWSSVYSGAKWNKSTGEDRYRRALYTYSKRTSGYPAFLTFDAPNRDVCCARRIRINTPLQALITMNDPAHIETTKAFAKRMTTHSAELRAQLAYEPRNLSLKGGSFVLHWPAIPPRKILLDPVLSGFGIWCLLRRERKNHHHAEEQSVEK